MKGYDPRAAVRAVRSMARILGVVAIAAVAVGSGVTTASAQQYPNKVIKVIVPFPPGGATDVLGRQVAETLRQKLGMSTIVENRAGANGIVGLDAFARSESDGYTLAVAGQSTVVLARYLYSSLPFDPDRDLVPVSVVATSTLVLVTPASVGAASVADFVSYAKANAGKLSYASTGNGSPQHLAGELFNKLAKIDLVHVPYKGAAATIGDLSAGRVQAIFAVPSSVMPLLQEGTLKALAVTSADRFSLMPNLPTMKESGIPISIDDWWGLFAPAGTPPAIIKTLNAAVQDIASSPDTKKRMATLGLSAAGGSPDAFAKRIAESNRIMGPLVKESGAKMD